MNLMPEDYYAAGLYARRHKLQFLKNDDDSGNISPCFSGPDSLRTADDSNSWPLDNVITNMTWVTSSDDETEHGEKAECPSGHIPVRVQCTYVKAKGIPVRFLNWKGRGITDADVGKLDVHVNCENKEMDLSTS